MTQEHYNTLTPFLPKWQKYQKDQTLQVEANDMERLHRVFVELNPDHPYQHKKALGCSNCRLAIFKDLFRQYDKFVPLKKKKRL